MEDEQLQGFLNSESQQGQIDSSGEFTLSRIRALRKLSKSLLEQPADWVLKMVQAAVAGSATEVRFFFFRKRVRVQFEIPRSRCPQPDQFFTQLTEPASQPTLWLKELFDGIRPFLAEHKLSFWFAGQVWFHWDGEQMSSEPNPKVIGALPCNFALVVHSSPKDLHFLTGRSRLTAREVTNLRDRACFSSIPIYLDSRRVSPAEPSQLKPNLKGTRTSLLAEGELCLSELLEGFQPSPEPSSSKPGSHPVLTWTSSSQADLHFSLRWRYKTRRRGTSGYTETVYGPFHVLLTRLGVHCATLTYKKSALEGYLQLDGKHLAVDLSGLSLESGPNAQRLIHDSIPLLKGLTSQLSAEMKKNSVEVRGLVRRAGGSLALGGLAGLAVNPLFGVTVAGLGFVAKTVLSSESPNKGLSKSQAAYRAVRSFEISVIEAPANRWKAGRGCKASARN